MIDRSAGEGIQPIGVLLDKLIQVQGYSLFSWQEFESRIRGGQNSYRLRINEVPKNASREQVDILLSMNPEVSKKISSIVEKTFSDKGESIVLTNQQAALKALIWQRAPALPLATPQTIEGLLFDAGA